VLRAVAAAQGDLSDAGGVEELRMVEAGEFAVAVALADEA
jgi:hypothetical protein